MTDQELTPSVVRDRLLTGDVLLTPEEVADILGVTRKTVLRYAHTGRLRRYVTLNGHSRYLLSDVDTAHARIRAELTNQAELSRTAS